MINKRILFMLAAIILLTLSACLPQVELEQAAQAVDTATATAEPITPTQPATSTLIETITLSPILETIPPSLTPYPTKELLMTTEPTSNPADQPTGSPTDEPTGSPADEQTGSPADEQTLQPGVQNWVDQAKEDLAQRLKISTAEIELLSFETKVWSDSSLGCPQPGMRYLQVLSEGYLIRLSAGDQVYNYHGGGSSPPFLCEKPGPEIVITKQAPLDIKEVATKIVPPPRD